MNEIMVLSTKKELIGQGYIYENIGKEFIYEGLSFLLKENGIRNYSNIPLFGYSNPRPAIIPRKPKWVLQLKDLEIVITDIK
jgi:hypothetical protein